MLPHFLPKESVMRKNGLIGGFMLTSLFTFARLHTGLRREGNMLDMN